MAFDMTIKIGDIKGESKIAADEMDVLAWSWGVSNSGSAHIGGGAGAGKANVQDLSFTKYVDKATPTLFKFVSNGKHIDSAVMTVRKAGGDKAVKYIVITLTDIIVTSVSTGGSGGEDRLTENVTLNFAKVKLEYTGQKKDGTPDTTVPYTYDIATNAVS